MFCLLLLLLLSKGQGTHRRQRRSGCREAKKKSERWRCDAIVQVGKRCRVQLIFCSLGITYRHYLIEQKDEKNFKAIIGKFNVKDIDGVDEVLNPELRIYNQPNIVTSEADIKTNLLSDYYVQIT